MFDRVRIGETLELKNGDKCKILDCSHDMSKFYQPTFALLETNNKYKYLVISLPKIIDEKLHFKHVEFFQTYDVAYAFFKERLRLKLEVLTL